MDYHSATHPPHSLDPYDIPDHYNQGHPWPDDHTQSHNPAFHYTPPYEQDWLPSHHDRPLSYHELVALGQQPIVNFGSTLWDALLEPERPRVPSLAYSPPDKPPDQTWYLSGCDVRAMPQSAWSAAYGGTSDVQDGVRDADACHPGLGHNTASPDMTSGASSIAKVSGPEKPPHIMLEHTLTLSLDIPKKKDDKKTVMACLFCRERKIACGPPPPDAVDRTCKQCKKRKQACRYPTECYRGQRRGGRKKKKNAEDMQAGKKARDSVS